MGESMITSFDGTKLYLKKETAADNKSCDRDCPRTL